MALAEAGRVCIKKSGRDAGDKAVVMKVIDSNFVEIMTHTRPKPRKVNARHLEFLAEKIDSKDASQLNSTLEIVQKAQASGRPTAPKK